MNKNNLPNCAQSCSPNSGCTDTFGGVYGSGSQCDPLSYIVEDEQGNMWKVKFELVYLAPVRTPSTLASSSSWAETSLDPVEDDLACDSQQEATPTPNLSSGLVEPKSEVPVCKEHRWARQPQSDGGVALGQVPPVVQHDSPLVWDDAIATSAEDMQTEHVSNVEWYIQSADTAPDNPAVDLAAYELPPPAPEYHSCHPQV